MNWLAVLLFAIVGVALIVWRQPAAHWQGMVAGARLHPGCAVAEGVAFLMAAAAVYVLVWH
jgi:hypothetical protein